MQSAEGKEPDSSLGIFFPVCEVQNPVFTQIVSGLLSGALEMPLPASSVAVRTLRGLPFRFLPLFTPPPSSCMITSPQTMSLGESHTIVEMKNSCHVFGLN